MQTFRVLRQHIGDRFYDPTGRSGPSTRQASPMEVQHLVETGVLLPMETQAATRAPEAKEKSAASARRKGPAADGGKEQRTE